MNRTDRIPISMIANNSQEWPMTHRRRKTRVVQVGDVGIGGKNPVRVQSMITAFTLDTIAAVEQTIRLYEAGAEIVRITAPNLREAQNLGEIKTELKRRGYAHIPIVADVHHQGTDIAVECAKYVEKVRINPGLFVFRKPDPSRTEYSPSEIQQELDSIEQTFLPVIQACKERGIAMRIGVNHGSLSERIKVTYGDSPAGMVESALEYLRLCEAHDFKNIIISMKASRVPVLLSANRLLAVSLAKEGMDYPIHLGVTEAGDGIYARVKSSIGIGTLLAEGIGDTIRVSLAEDPVNEIEVCYDILQALGLRKTKVEYIACPSCGRTKFDLPTVLNEVRDATKHLVGLDIAVMGCLPPHERVATEAGFQPIGQIKAGIQVLTHEGLFAPVSKVHEHDFSGELIAIHPRGAPLLQLTPNHPVFALTRTSSIRSGRKRWQNVAELLQGGQEPKWYPAEAITRDHVLLYPVLKGEHPVGYVPEAPDLPVHDDWLLLAACYCAEGSIGGTIDTPRQLFFSFGIHERELAERIALAAKGYGASTALRTRLERNTCEVIVHSTQVAVLFAQLFGRRAENKRLPSWMLTLPHNRQATLLRALWQCDGYIGTVQGDPRATYVTVSPTLAFQVHQLLLRQGVAATLLIKQPAHRQAAYYVSVTNANALRRFAKVLNVPIRIPDARGKSARIVLDENYLYMPVLSVQKVAYHGKVHNLEVTKAHTFTASLCLTHNCIVNGPGEMADADYGYVGRGPGKIALYRGHELVKNDIPSERGVEELVTLLKADGVWQEPGGDVIP